MTPGNDVDSVTAIVLLSYLITIDGAFRNIDSVAPVERAKLFNTGPRKTPRVDLGQAKASL